MKRKLDENILVRLASELALLGHDVGNVVSEDCKGDPTMTSCRRRSTQGDRWSAATLLSTNTQARRILASEKFPDTGRLEQPLGVG
jgi:hypothetical protein